MQYCVRPDLQARLGKLPAKAKSIIGSVSAWTATLLFMWAPVAQWVRIWWPWHFRAIWNNVEEFSASSSVFRSRTFFIQSVALKLLTGNFHGSGKTIFFLPTSEGFLCSLFCWLWSATPSSSHGPFSHAISCGKHFRHQCPFCFSYEEQLVLRSKVLGVDKAHIPMKTRFWIFLTVRIGALSSMHSDECTVFHCCRCIGSSWGTLLQGWGILVSMYL